MEWLECATGPAVIAALDRGGVDVAILDGEATPTGGMGIAGRPRTRSSSARRSWCSPAASTDGWLATWSRAEAAVPHPLDPIVLAEAVADLMRRRRAELPGS